MKKQDGIALIATLLIMAAIMALGVGTMFLSTMNLKIAENSRTHAVARYNAEAGMEAAIVKLKRDYEAATPKQFPAADAFVLPTSPDASTVTYQTVSYTPYTAAGSRTQARVVIVGIGPNNARYQTEALFATEVSGSDSLVDSIPFPQGLASEEGVYMSGSPTLNNAPLHGNRGFDISGNGNYQTCDEGGVNCRELTGSNRPVTAARNMTSYICKATGSNNSGLCRSDRPSTLLDDPVDLKNIPFSRLRNGDANSPSKFGVKSTDTLTSNTSVAGCTVTSAVLLPTYPAGAKVCITGGATIPNNASYANVTIVVKGDVTIPGTASFKDVNLLSMGTLNLNGTTTLENTRLFADTKVNFLGTINYSGLTTIASGGDIEYNNGSYINNLRSKTVSLAILAVNNFKGQGMRGSNGDYVNAAIWAGGTAEVSGSSRIRGGVAAVGNVSFNGSAEIYGQSTFTNPDLAKEATAGGEKIAAVSRR